MDVEQNKSEFIQIYRTIKRKGHVRLLKWLLNSDFFTAPASGKHHLAEEGGLCRHSVNVYHRLRAMVSAEYGEEFQKIVSEETIAICGLLHDICKVDFYSVEQRNVKVDGQWIQQPFYKVSEKLPYGHGEKSVYIAQSFMRLSREESMSINWHMGGFDERVGANSFRIGEAYKQFPLAVMLHLADMQATYLNENHALQKKLENALLEK